MDQILNSFAFIIVVMLFLGVLPVVETALALLGAVIIFPELDAVSAGF
ncbi:MAG TPA: hypothetical protein VI875_03400 [Candidatus Norongarragalinales archaeon]|nr:hypothetical protein [Candidatus Norongarragalinales archaeon]